MVANVVDCLTFSCSWGRDFVGNCLVALQCKSIHYYFNVWRDINSRERITHEIHEQWPPPHEQCWFHSNLLYIAQALIHNFLSPFCFEFILSVWYFSGHVRCQCWWRLACDIITHHAAHSDDCTGTLVPWQCPFDLTSYDAISYQLPTVLHKTHYMKWIISSIVNLKLSSTTTLGICYM